MKMDLTELLLCVQELIRQEFHTEDSIPLVLVFQDPTDKVKARFASTISNRTDAIKMLREVSTELERRQN